MNSSMTSRAGYDFSQVKALTFDVFGTVVDWRSSMIKSLNHFFDQKFLKIDVEQFADRWRLGYQPAMEQIRNGSRVWTKLDELHREILDELLEASGLSALNGNDRERLVGMWHQLEPWSDAVCGLRRLSTRFTLATLSNANVSMLIDMARFGGLRWDCILSAELVRTYKPRSEVYAMATHLLDAEPFQIMMVAAHDDDLRAARALGFCTAYVHRPKELFPGNPVIIPPDGFFDLMTTDLHDLSDQLDC